MLSKLKAARKLSRAGIPMIIAGGKNPGILDDIVSGTYRGTYFVPGPRRFNSRQCWISFTLKPQGAIVLDAGAVGAIRDKGKSILPIGVIDAHGSFNVGACVEIKDGAGTVLGKGLVNYSSSDIRCIMGLKSSRIEEILGSKPYDDVIHRDNMALGFEQG
jgi:glutamate 5-kinase